MYPFSRFLIAAAFVWLQPTFAHATCFVADSNKILKPDSIKTYELKIKIFDNETYKSLDNAYVFLCNRTKNTVDSVWAVGGLATFVVQKGCFYDCVSTKSGYLKRKSTVDVSCYKKDSNKIVCISGMDLMNIIKKPNTKNEILDCEMGMKRIVINQTFKLENLYYNVNQATIRPDAAKALNRLVVILKDNPSIIIELGSHTDCRAKNDYNMQLSQQRADSAVNYIIKKGIDQQRIASKGYGEMQPLNRCADGVACSETEHQMNRRTEIKITGFVGDKATQK